MQLVLITFFYTEIYIYIYVYNISNLANLQRTVTNKKCEKVYTNRIITRWNDNKFAYKKDEKKSIKIPYVLNKISS